jgi:hypothetical protein
MTGKKKVETKLSEAEDKLYLIQYKVLHKENGQDLEKKLSPKHLEILKKTEDEFTARIQQSSGKERGKGPENQLGR